MADFGFLSIWGLSGDNWNLSRRSLGILQSRRFQLTYDILRHFSNHPFCYKKYSNVASKIFWSQSMLDFFFVYHTTLTLTLAMLCCNGKVLRAVRAIFALFFCIGKFRQKVFSFFFLSSSCNEKKVHIEATEEEQSELKWQI